MARLAQLQGYWQQAKQEWQANKRLQLFSIVAVVLVILWVHVKLNDWRIAKQADARVALTAYQDTQVVARESEWPERAKASNEVLKTMRAKLWRAASEGEAEAKLRDWLQKLAKESGMPIDRLNVEVGASPRGFTWVPVHADIQGKYQAGLWQSMLEVMCKNTPSVVVDLEQLNIAYANSLIYRLNVTVWFVIEDSAGAEQ